MKAVIEDQFSELIQDRYELYGEIGRGAFGVVYKARQKSTSQIVAIKRLLIPEIKDPNQALQQKHRFFREIELLGKLKNNYIVSLVDAGYDHDPWMAIEFVDGVDLFTYLKKKGSLEPKEAIRFIFQILEGVSEAHKQGVVHRDLKPANIMVFGEGLRKNIKILDFGIAGVECSLRDPSHYDITQGKIALGTPSYMGLEQFTSFINPIPPSDIYAIGIILLECLSGERVFKEVNPVLIFELKQKRLPIDPSIENTQIGQIILRACSRHPDDRFQNAGEMLDALESALEENDALYELKLSLEAESSGEIQDTVFEQPAFVLKEEDRDKTSLINDENHFNERKLNPPRKGRSFVYLFLLLLLIAGFSLLYIFELNEKEIVREVKNDSPVRINLSID